MFIFRVGSDSLLKWIRLLLIYGIVDFISWFLSYKYIHIYFKPLLYDSSFVLLPFSRLLIGLLPFLLVALFFDSKASFVASFPTTLPIIGLSEFNFQFSLLLNSSHTYSLFAFLYTHKISKKWYFLCNLI